MLDECEVACPACGARFVALIDPGDAGSEYIQDCEVCCRPLRFVLGPGDAGNGPELAVFPENEA